MSESTDPLRPESLEEMQARIAHESGGVAVTVRMLVGANEPIGWKCDRCKSVVYMTTDDTREPDTVRWDHTCATWETPPEHPTDGSPHQWADVTTFNDRDRTHRCVKCTAVLTEPR